MALKANSKLLSHAVGPYCIISTTYHFIIIHQYGIPDISLAERASPAPNFLPLQGNIFHDEQDHASSGTSVMDPKKISKQTALSKDEGKELRKIPLNIRSDMTMMSSKNKFPVR